MKQTIQLIAMTLLLLGVTTMKAHDEQPDATTFWKDGYALQTTVKTPAVNSKTITARVNGNWQNFDLVEFPDQFMSWNKAKRIETIDFFKEMMKGESKGKSPDLAGPHNGIVATTGYLRKDAAFSLNNAVKGMGFLPRYDKIEAIITLLEETIEAAMPKKLEILNSLYERADSLFAKDRQVSLELYSTPEYMTQSFLNQMYNPISTIVFLDMQSYKLKTIVRLLDPNNPELTEYERNVVKYINLVHSYFHGKFPKDFIASIYYVTQVYDNSPRGKTPEKGMGRRIVPLFP